MDPDTIFALATAPGRSGVAVVRLSGPRAFEVAERLTGPLPPSHRAALRTLRDPDGRTIDHALILCFDAGHSFTGEQTVEFQLHGSVAVVSALQRLLSGHDGVRLAEPGEFTRRALEGGRLDLTQVEGLADLIAAETESQRVQALRGLEGELGRQAEVWRRDLLRAAALIEATIDFADEDVPIDVAPEVISLLERTTVGLRAEIVASHAAERVRDGFEVAIVGPPNIGKSTIFNWLAGREAAITSEVAGTTRDVIEVRMDINGLAVTLLDTAGLRATEDRIETLGVELARRRAKSADLRVVLVEHEGDSVEIELGPDDIVVVGKIDIDGPEALGVSGLTGQGVDVLMSRIGSVLAARMAGAGLTTRLRHREAMTAAADALTSALSHLRMEAEHAEVTAEDIRAAVRCLDRLIGRIGVEDVLGEIFSAFCIGK